MNRGLRQAQGEILAYLNCDEQYLAGALAAVRDFFERNPEIDVLFADFVVLDGEEQLFIPSQGPKASQAPMSGFHHLPTFTCATFFHKLIFEQGLFFDPKLRDVGDGKWVLSLLKRGTPMAVLRRFTSFLP